METRCKKSLNILRIAATDKENLTSRINKKKMEINTNNKGSKETSGKRLKKNTDKNKSEIQVKNNINKTKTENTTQSVSELESDLTIDNPSENYWKNLAESRRKALDSALKENVDLHNKVNELEYENSRLKEMLEEAKSLVDVLTEMIEQNEDNQNGNNESENGEDSVLDQSNETSSDSDPEEASFG